MTKPSELPIFTMIEVEGRDLFFRDRSGDWVEAYAYYNPEAYSPEMADSHFQNLEWKIVALPVEESR